VEPGTPVRVTLAVIRSALIPRTADRPPVVVLVVDDSDDDQLVEAVAQATDVPSERFGGAWTAETTDAGDAVAFLLVERGGGIERRLELVDWPADHLRIVAEAPHYVALLPLEFAGDVGARLELSRLGAAIIVSAEASESVAGLLAHRRR
jgi:hypothetical protein